jgi:hypothetical protein
LDRIRRHRPHRPGGEQQQEEQKLTRLVTRAALIAGIAVGASGLVALPAMAANGVATANYYVNNPAIGPAANLTPESAVVTASIDTGGSPESLIPVSSAGLLWSGLAGVTITSEKWNDGTAPTATNSGSYAPIDGIPDSGSNSNVSVTVTDTAINNGGVTDPGIGAASGVAQPISNAGADNYSDVTFEYDPVSDFVASGDTAGPETEFAQDIQVPTTAGVSSVKTTLGAFGLSAQNNSGNTPLTPGTKYYYWVVQQAGGTDQATNVNVAAWTGNTSGTPAVAANNSYKCYPNVAIAADPTLESYVQPGATVNYGGQVLPASQGPCIYYYGNTGGALYYQSPNGEFSTPKLGTLAIGKTATVAGKKGTVAISNKSAYKASGTVQLTTKGGKVLANGKFALQANKAGKIALKLTKAGASAANKHQSAKVVLTSNWDQPSSTKSIKL